MEDESVRELEAQPRLFDLESEVPTCPRRQQKRPIDAMLIRNQRSILVDTDFPLERQRLATSHEIGHYYLPWHENLTYFKNGCVVDPPGKGQYELEASRFAADLLMPPPFFREDMESLPFGLESLERLSRRYLTSLEATARQYVDLSLRTCALVIVEALPHEATTENGASLKVRYCHKSHSFNHFICPGTEVASESPIAQASLGWSGSTITDEVPGLVLGLRPDRRLILHALPVSGERRGCLSASTETPGKSRKAALGALP